MDPVTEGFGLIAVVAKSGKSLLELLGVIESNLDALKGMCKKDVQSSLCHYEKGIERLNLAESKKEELEKIEERQKLAQESFIEADKEASNAFHNESLKIEERIIACLVCIASSILRHYNDSEAAEKDSMVYLKILHSLPEIGKMFSKMKPALFKDERAINVDNVIIINLLLANFMSINPSKSYAVLDWPLIKCGEKMFHPLYFKEVERVTSSSTPWHEYHFRMDESDLFVYKQITITNEGEMLIFSGKNLQKVDSETGKLQPWCKESCEIDDSEVKCMTVGNNGVVYVLSGCESKKTYQLTMFQQDGTIQQSTLKFLGNKDGRNLLMSVTQDERIVVAFVEGDQRNITVRGCYKDGELFLKKLKEKGKPSLIFGEMKTFTVSSDNKIAIIVYREERFRKFHKLLTYSMEGDLIKVMKFDPTLKEIRAYDEVIYTPDIGTITGYYFNKSDSKLVVEIFSTVTKKHHLSLVLMKTEYDSGMFDDKFRFVQHANGKVALVTKERVLHLKKSFALEESFVSHINSQSKSIVEKNKKTFPGRILSFFSAKKFPGNMVRLKINLTARKGTKTVDNSKSK
ncbi:uncharacterized protein LOC124438515 [Xenia sp. Carnegie-2017]|uniref:uncharacterized protein LOC124438515 n=1 Tax=Xenia sp. Carnegie-2017 TaxID=2897299 RepID=UPI001F037ECD|nr:uncharacterized protein LOC124438515 [Xenia sp. Carnegie-2017]XP_046844633.1 uncharacterized protein LOC124438515 [Xenia sp. Carnegie-2017]XP_046844634.1 uncharacterized protein LOC124438515 [Xenia sp. Carnegie-2017]XP_046844635.1 uncharacterized protein LOC124438515 [Xenia sp. Carnegie-2017]